MASEGTIDRLALGSVADLGSLYDARTDKFCGLSILNQEPPTSAVKKANNYSTDCKFVYVDKMSDKFTQLDMSADLSLSILSGLVTVKGSAEYFKDEKRSARAVQVTLSYKITTTKEELIILNPKLKQCMELDTLNHVDATHVLVGIDWGANLMVTAEYKNAENRDALKVEGDLEAELKNMAKGLLNLEGRGRLDHRDEGSDRLTEFSLSVRGDVLTEGELPQTIEGARELMAKLPTLARKANGGKGQPLRYTLLPLSKLRSYFSINLAAEQVYKTLSEDAVLRTRHLFDDFNKVKQKLNDLYEDVMKFEPYLPNSVRETVEQRRNLMAVSESQLRSNVQYMLVQVRSGVLKPLELEKLREEYENSPDSAQKVLDFISTQYGAVQTKIIDFKRWEQIGIKLVPKSESDLQQKLLDHKGKDCYVLFCEPHTRKDNSTLWNKTFRVYQRLMKADEAKHKHEFLYVDLEAAPHLLPESEQKIVIQHFKDGECLSADVLADREMCFVKCNTIDPALERPSERVALEIRCARSLTGRCDSQDYKWACLKCKSEVEYGWVGGYFYCRCGRGKADSFSYRCSSDSHGEGFEPFPVDGVILKGLLGKLRPTMQYGEWILDRLETDLNDVTLSSYHSDEVLQLLRGMHQIFCKCQC